MEKNYRAELTACLGDPVDGNPSGVMEEAAFAAAGLNWRYLTIRVPEGKLEDAVSGLKAMGFRGFNLTMPHKIRIIPLLDDLSEAAKIIGAVNTVVNREGRLFGDNTDGKGFVAALAKEKISLSGKRVTILGAGGAARAIAVECALAGAEKIYVINRTVSKGRQLAELICEKTRAEGICLPWEGDVAVPEDTDILVNATCVGLYPDVQSKPRINYDSIQENMVVCDVVFNPVDPLFLQQARLRGAKTVSGIGMLVQQGALGFTLWTGLPASEQAMYQVLEQEFTAT